VKLGLVVMTYDWLETPDDLGATFGSIARTAEQAGFDSLWTVDHLFAPYPSVDGPTHEAYTSLAYLAAHTSRVKLGVMVTDVMFRFPSVLVKQVTTLDVLTRGRAWLGIGAGWFDREHLGMGIPFPPARERLDRLEETILLARQMWSGCEAPFRGRYYQLEETLNSPPSISKPHPPIMIGGQGEQRTLRLVAQYADACNFFMSGPPTVEEKLEVLQRHCSEVGRDYDDIERTVAIPMEVERDGSGVDDTLELLAEYARLGVQTVMSWVANLQELWPLEIIGERIIPAAARM